MALILSRNMKSLWFPLTCKLTSPSQLWELACWDWGASAVRRYPLPVLGAGKRKVRSPAGYSVCHGLSFWLVESGCALPGSYFRGQRTQVFPSPLLVSIPPLPNFLLRAAISNHSHNEDRGFYVRILDAEFESTFERWMDIWMILWMLLSHMLIGIRVLSQRQRVSFHHMGQHECHIFIGSPYSSNPARPELMLHEQRAYALAEESKSLGNPNLL